MNKHEYICRITKAVALKSNCTKRKVGAVFVNKDREILATGYNSTPIGFPPCHHFHGLTDKCEETIHAEQNAIIQAAKRGTALEGSILYCTYMPCITCARFLINLRVLAVYYKENNTDGGVVQLHKAGITFYQWKNV